MARKKLFDKDEYNDIHEMASRIREYSDNYNRGESISEDNIFFEKEIAFRRQNYNKDMKMYKKKALKRGGIHKRLVM